MPKEYIEREHVVDAVLDVYCDTPDIDLSCEKFEAAILKIQAADVAPVRHGRWLHRKNGVAYCSECKIDTVEDETNYCPNCGATMKLED